MAACARYSRHRARRIRWTCPERRRPGLPALCARSWKPDCCWHSGNGAAKGLWPAAGLGGQPGDRAKQKVLSGAFNRGLKTPPFDRLRGPAQGERTGGPSACRLSRALPPLAMNPPPPPVRPEPAWAAPSKDEHPVLKPWTLPPVDRLRGARPGITGVDDRIPRAPLAKPSPEPAHSP